MHVRACWGSGESRTGEEIDSFIGDNGTECDESVALTSPRLVDEVFYAVLYLCTRSSSYNLFILCSRFACFFLRLFEVFAEIGCLKGIYEIYRKIMSLILKRILYIYLYI